MPVNNINDFFNLFKDSDEGNSIGKMIASQIGVGIDENSYLAVTAMENVYVELETVYKNASKNAAALQNKQHKRALSNLKNSLKLDLITEQEYYEKLKEYRDAHFRQGTDDWFKCTEEIVFYNRRMAEEVEKEQEKMAESIASIQNKLKDKLLALRSDLSEKLTEDSSPWYTQNKIIFKNMGVRGTDLTYFNSDISDFDSEISTMRGYHSAILALKELGNIPDGIFSDISQMDMSQGLAAATAILNATDSERARFIDGYNQRNALADSISKELHPILNKEAIQNAAIDAAYTFNDAFFKTDEEHTAEFIQILEESFGEVPSSYYDLGNNSADAFRNGFMENAPQVMSDIRSYVMSNINSLAMGLLSSIQGQYTNPMQGTSNTYNNSYNFNTSKETTTQQLMAAKNAAMLERLRGGYE